LSKLNNQSSVTLLESLRNASFVAEMLDWGDKFVMAKDQTDLFVNNPNGFFDLVAGSTLDGQILVASLDNQGVFLIANSRMSILDTILNSSKSMRFVELETIAKLIPSSQNGELARNKNHLWHIFDAARKESVLDRGQLAFMLGVANHESQEFNKMEESDGGDPSYFTGYDRLITLMNDVEGDGPRYKGRGFIQLTGKLRYFYYTVNGFSLDGKRIDLYRNPELASNLTVAARILVDYLKYGKISTRADWQYKATSTRPDRGLNGKFTSEEMKSHTQRPEERYVVLVPREGNEASMNSAGLNLQSANYGKFVDTAAIVNAYDSAAQVKIASMSEKFFNVLGRFDPRSR
jgi:hypothetical protein